jgi:hypothetical protein
MLPGVYVEREGGLRRLIRITALPDTMYGSQKQIQMLPLCMARCLLLNCSCDGLSWVTRLVAQ